MHMMHLAELQRVTWDGCGPQGGIHNTMIPS